MSDTKLPKIIFYDIDNILTPPTRSWSPATCRTLLALRHRKLPYTRVAVSYPDIAALLKSKGVAPDQKGPTPYTLPAIDMITASDDDIAVNEANDEPGNETHAEHGTVVQTIMDSEPISHALEAAVPPSSAHPSLYPLRRSAALAARMQAVVAAGATAARMHVLPAVPRILDARGREYFERTRREWLGRSLDEVAAQAAEELARDGGGGGGGAGQRGLVGVFEDALEAIAAVYLEEQGRDEGEGADADADAEGVDVERGPFLGARSQPSYPDFIMVACVEWWRCARGNEVVNQALENVKGGILARVVEGCESLLY